MIQEIEAGIIIKDTENPSTVRDFLKIYLRKDRLINKFDVYRDNNDVIIELSIRNGVYYYPGYNPTRWEPGEPEHLEGLLDEDDLRDWITDVLDLKFKHDDYSVEFDDNTYIPNEDEMLDEYREEQWRTYDEF